METRAVIIIWYMFRVKYTIAEVARLLRRSIPSLIRDVEMGRLTMGGSRVVMRRRGASRTC